MRAGWRPLPWRRGKVVGTAEPERSGQAAIVREVIECPTSDVIDTLHARRDEGYIFGDWQYDIDDSRDLVLTRGIMSCYRPLEEGEDVPEGHGRIQMSRDKWIDLMRIA